MASQHNSPSTTSFRIPPRLPSNSVSNTSPPFLDIPGVFNFRDIGRPTASDTIPIRKGFVYRSADPTRITSKGLEVVEGEIGVKTVFDFRLRRERDAAKGLVGSNADVIWAPLMDEEDGQDPRALNKYDKYFLDAKSVREAFASAYLYLLTTRSSRISIRILLLHVRDRPNTPIILHCTGGKDRTGVVAAILLALAGCSDESIAHEYSLTEQAFPETMRDHIIAKMVESGKWKGDRAAVELVVGARPEAMLGLLEEIRKEYGNVAVFVKQMYNLRDEDILEIKENLSSTR